jgi:hypothetical protein
MTDSRYLATAYDCHSSPFRGVFKAFQFCDIFVRLRQRCVIIL